MGVPPPPPPVCDQIENVQRAHDHLSRSWRSERKTSIILNISTMASVVLTKSQLHSHVMHGPKIYARHEIEKGKKKRSQSLNGLWLLTEMLSTKNTKEAEPPPPPPPPPPSWPTFNLLLLLQRRKNTYKTQISLSTYLVTFINYSL